MKKVSVELGINDNKGLPILGGMLGDLKRNTKIPEKKIKFYKNCLNQVLAFLSQSSYHSGITESYNNILQSKQFKTTDKIKILSWLFYPSTAKPLCLYLKEERRKMRKVKRNISIKRKSNEKPPIRFELDDEFIKEIQGKKRKRYDIFDKLDENTKIIWARYVIQILGDTEYCFRNVVRQLSVDKRIDESVLITFAMKYACKLCGISYFKGRFLEPYWILYRAKQFCELYTQQENDVFIELNTNVKCASKSSEIINVDESIKKVIPVLKDIGLYDKYLQKNKELRKLFKYSSEEDLKRRSFQSIISLIQEENNF